jgi:hypothetical protein
VTSLHTDREALHPLTHWHGRGGQSRNARNRAVAGDRFRVSSVVRACERFGDQPQLPEDAVLAGGEQSDASWTTRALRSWLRC